MSDSYEIRSARAEDAVALGGLLQRVFRATYGSRIPDQILESYLKRVFGAAQVAVEIAQTPQFHLVASFEGCIVGAAKLALGSPEGHALPNSVELARLYVDPIWHGKGVAQALLMKTYDQCREFGFKNIWLCAWEENRRALAFYQKHGFEAFGTMPVFVDTVRFEDILLRRSI